MSKRIERAIENLQKESEGREAEEATARERAVAQEIQRAELVSELVAAIYTLEHQEEIAQVREYCRLKSDKIILGQISINGRHYDLLYGEHGFYRWLSGYRALQGFQVVEFVLNTWDDREVAILIKKLRTHILQKADDSTRLFDRTLQRIAWGMGLTILVLVLLGYFAGT